jgi:hypothetical protein
MKTWPVLLLFLAVVARAALPGPTVPVGLGVSIHFTGAPAETLDAIAATGFRLVRMDLFWHTVERKKGEYIFDEYDALVNGLTARGMRALFILDYGNALYGPFLAITTAEGRAAFARFAGAAAARYRGRGVIWELWNEPNTPTAWAPVSDAAAYTALVAAAAPAIRAADPGATIIAPAVASTDLSFLERCFRLGMLQHLDALSLHPYRPHRPETVADELFRVRVLMAQYAPDRPCLPLVSSEWGYSSEWAEITEARQGQYLARQALTNLAQGLPLSVWYDWHDDGTDPTNPEHHFGVVTFDNSRKPAALEMARLSQALAGMRFVKRLSTPPDDYLLLFSDGVRAAVAAWTVHEPHPRTLWPGTRVTLTGNVQYLPVPATATALLAEGAWTVAQPTWGVALSGAPAPAFTVRVTNPFAHPVRVTVDVQRLENLSGTLAGPHTFTLAPGDTTERRWSGVYRPRLKTDALARVAVTVGGVRRRQEVRFRPVVPHRKEP